MVRDNPRIVAGLLVAIAVVTIVILRGLVGTLFFAITAAYVLVPLSRLLQRRGLPAWWAAAVTTALTYLFGLALFVPIGAVLYFRRSYALALLRSLPDSFTISVAEFTYVVGLVDLQRETAQWLTSFAISLARAAPILTAKVVVFGLVLFALVYRGDRLKHALLDPLPTDYHDTVAVLHERVSKTLFVLYFIQAATAIATFVLALIVFLVLGVRSPVTLAVLAGLLQFLPIVGPSLVIGAIVIAGLLAGDVTGAVVMGAVGFVVVGVLPDAVLRPRLAKGTARLPASLYFVGFTGGLLSLGPVGIIAGPVTIAIMLQLVELLAEGSPAVAVNADP